MAETTHVEDEARRLVEALPEDATWGDVARLVLERQRVEEGINDLEADLTWTSDQIRDKLGIPR